MRKAQRLPLGVLVVLGLTASVGTAAGATTDTGTTTPASAEPTGEPIELMMIVALTTQPQYPDRLAAAKAAAAAINEHGGVAGRPLEITSCDAKNDAAEEANCAQQLADSDAVTVVGPNLQKSTAVNDMAVQEHIALIGPTGVGATDLLQETSTSFPLAVPATSLLTCPAAMADAGVTNIGALTYVGAGAERLVGGAQAVIANVPGAAFTGLTTVDFGATDMAGPLQTAIDNGAEGLILGLGEPQAVATMQANNGRVTTCTADGVLTPQALSDLGDAGDGWTVMSSVPPLEFLADAGGMATQFVDEMAAYYEATGDEGAAPENLKGAALGGWMAVQAFAQVAGDLDEITRDSVLEAFTNTTDLEFPGLLEHPVDFTAFQPVPTLARLFVSEYRVYTWSAADQAWTAGEELYDVVKLLTGA